MPRRWLLLLMALLVNSTTTYAQEAGFQSLFDGSTFEGWEDHQDLFRIEDGAIVGGTLTSRIDANAFLCTTQSYDDFELRLKAKLIGPGDNAGIQFRSRRVPGHHEVSGYQADMGSVSASWFYQVMGKADEVPPEAKAPVWGSLYDETRRNRYLAWGHPDDVAPVLKKDDWNDMTVRAVGPMIQIWVNGVQTVTYTEHDHIPRSGAICLQIHSGAPAEAWHKDLMLKEIEDDYHLISFQKTTLSDLFYAEGANFGDLNGDGGMDLVAGPFWYEGPTYEQAHAFYEPKPFDPEGYSDNFFPYVYDFNQDGRSDILVIGFPGQTATWYENPGHTAGHWPAHVVFDTVDNESPAWTDLTGDGRPEIVCIAQGRYGYVQPDWSDPSRPWTFHPITPDEGWQRFTHGLGVGDVNGDGRMDVLERDGWWQQPATLEGDPVWAKHAFSFAEYGGAQMYAYDVDGDGDNDVITSLQAHGHGLAWFEHVQKNGKIDFVRHMIMKEKPEENRYGIVFGELHALDLIDIDGDGLKDIVTGKRWWSHGAEGDPDLNPKPYLYWFRLVRSAEGVDFVPHLIDDDTGIGVQVVAGDLNGDRHPDVVVSNKKGTAVLLQKRQKVSAAEWRKAQPKPR